MMLHVPFFMLSNGSQPGVLDMFQERSRTSVLMTGNRTIYYSLAVFVYFCNGRQTKTQGYFKPMNRDINYSRKHKLPFILIYKHVVDVSRMKQILAWFFL